MSKKTIEYKKLKSAIIKSAHKSGGKRENAFEIDFDKLATQVASMDLVPVVDASRRPEDISRRIDSMDIIPLNEYFYDQKLEWFDKAKWISYIAFVDSSECDPDELNAILRDLATKPEDDPDIDHVELMAELASNYPCYYACIISYRSNNPSFMDSNSYIVVCRANKVIIKNPDYVYNSKEYVDPVEEPTDTPTDNNQDNIDTEEAEG